MAEGIALRDAGPEDAAFLARLYAETRRQEVSAWGWPPQQQEWFLQMQFDAQRRSYQASFPEAQDRIILCGDKPIGHVLTSDENGSIRLIDIALVEEERGQGIGTSLLRSLMQECLKNDRALHLQVAQGNPAMRLYQRLGFESAGGDAVYLRMEWKPFSGQKDL